MNDTGAVCVLTGTRPHRESQCGGDIPGRESWTTQNADPAGSTSRDGETPDLSAGRVTPMTRRELPGHAA